MREAHSVTSTASNVKYDPYDLTLNADPYPAFAAIREEQPLYYNADHDFYALSRYADVNAALVDFKTFSSARGAILELIKANIPIPPGVVIFEDPPIHDIHRKLLSRMFTPRRCWVWKARSATTVPPASIRSWAPATSTSSRIWARRCR